MILNIIQKNQLLHNVDEMLKSFGPIQEKSEFVEVIDRNKVYSVETNGKIIIFYDYKDPDVFIFDSFEDFKKFVWKEL